MTRQVRLQYENAIYHVRSIGNQKQPIFLDDGDRVSFLKFLRATVRSRGWLCHAYCLMENHYHLLVETPVPNLSQGMHDLNCFYANTFNVKHSQPGHLFEGRFRSSLVDEDDYFLTLARYIPLNPVAAGLTADPAEWRWSSFNATCGEESYEDFIEKRLLLSYFESSPVAKDAYREFVLDGIPLIKQKVKAPPLRKLISKDMPKDELTKNIARAFFEFEYSLREIGAVLGICHTTVGRRVKCWRETHQSS